LRDYRGKKYLSSAELIFRQIHWRGYNALKKM
jgi:hypothetical protein